jgi:CheY-like chemotaxis protein
MNEATDHPIKRVLLVDDDPGVRTVTARMLQLGGYATVEADNGLVALERFEQEPCDVVITDRSMAELSGEELAEQIKDRSPHTPVILITGFAYLAQRPELFAAVLPKPFRIDDLLTAVAQVLDN